MTISFRTLLIKLFQIFHFLSIEIAAGVLLQAWTIQYFLHYEYPFGYMPLISLVVLWIYWTDKFLDLKSVINSNLLPERHQWFFKHRKMVFIAWLALTLSILMALVLLPYEAWSWAIPAAVATVGYLIVNYLLKNNFWMGLMKEICVALIYSYALWYLPITQTRQESAIVFSIITFLLAYQNLLMLAYLDKETDLSTQTHSTIQGLGKRNSEYLITFVSITGISVLGWAWQWDKVMTFCMFLVFLWQILFFFLSPKKPQAYRPFWDYGFFLIGLYHCFR